MRHALWSCGVLLFGAQFASAAPITWIRDDSVYELHADGSYTLEQSGALRINSPQGVRAAGELPLGYSESMQKLEVLEAYTTTRDGKRIDVGPGGIRDQESRASSNAPMFSDRKTRVIIYPQVEVGSVVSTRFRRTQLKPDIPGLFSMWETLSGLVDVESSTVTLRAPANLELYIDTRGADGGEIPDPPPGMREWRWSFKPSKGAPAEPRQVNARDLGPYIMASTFAGWDDLAKAYDARAAEMARPSPAIRKLADEITAGIKDRREQARLLYQWVGTNIRYVAIHLEDGGFVPHSAEAIYEARYGDCKDHATILHALLAAKKIPSSTVLLNAADSYFVPRIVTARAFNHAITWLPDFDLFVDSTPGLLPFGVLTSNEYGKQVLVVDVGKGKSALRTLPLPAPGNDWIDTHADYVVGADGTITGRTYGESGGLYQGIDRQAMNSLSPDQRAQLVNRAMGQRGTARLEAGDPRNFEKPFTYGTRLEMPQYFKLPGPGAYRLQLGNGRLGGTLDQFSQMMSEPTRTLPMSCPAPGRRTETATIKLAPGTKVTQLPDGVNVTMKYGSFTSKYELKDDTLTATRTLTLEYPSAVCPPEDYAALRDLAGVVGKQSQEQFLYD